MLLIIVYQLVGAAVILALLLLAPFAPVLRRGLAQRLGLRSGRVRAPGAPQPGVETVWIHAASVGEVRAAAPLIGMLLARRPGSRVLLSTFTTSGLRVAAQSLAAAEPRVRCRLLPIDWGWIPGRVIRRERPSLFILLETEIWPVLLAALRAAGVPVLIANGRVSPRSFGRYRFLRRALRPALGAVTLALVRTAEDAARFAAIGLDPSRIRVAGNLKHSRRAAVDPISAKRQAAIRLRLGCGAGRPVLVAGSVRGSESDLALAVFCRLKALVPELLLVLAPRHPERFDTTRVEGRAGAWVRWSAAPPEIDRDTAVVLLDTLGELADIYAAASVACVGGTWSGHGGHNLLEPAFHGVPVVFGPDYRHFDDEGRALLAAGGGFVAADAAALFERCRGLLSDRGARDEVGRLAREVAAAFGGAAALVVSAAGDLLDGRTPPA